MKALNHKYTFAVKLALILSLGVAVQMATAQNSYTGTQEGEWFRSVSTDKSRYDPLETAEFNVAFKQRVVGKTLVVMYDHLDSTVSTDTVQIQNSDSVSIKWQVPDIDFQGYMAKIYLFDSGTLLDFMGIGLDVSSDWSRFPRYGFLSSYPLLSESTIDSTISVLNRYHINGLQFYDWQYKHNEPLAGTVLAPSPYWNDIANRTNYLSTVEGYINAAHARGMKAMDYNLLYGAYANAYQDGVDDSWSLYQDPNHQTRDFYQLPSGWASNLYIMDPGNENWRSYIFAQERKVFLALGFDGWHVDQLGYLGNLWNYAGQPVDVPGSFQSFLTEAKSQLNVDLVMNAVGQYGQTGIARAPVDFLYTEVWDPDSTYGDLVRIINDNSTYGLNRLHTVLAAYMDYNKTSGFFNTPGILFTDAVIFASGGDHLELGEHMLSREYFPANYLQMSDSLQRNLVHYYDFMVSYENLLRDGETSVSLPLSAEIGSASASLANQPVSGSIWDAVSMKSNYIVINLVNFSTAKSMAWRDRYGIQSAPDTITGVTLNFPSGTRIRNVWTASPDFYDGAPTDLPFSQSGGTVSMTLPKLLYWSMVVVRLDTTITSVNSSSSPESFSLEQNYPNPFNPATRIRYTLSKNREVHLRVYDVLGRVVATLVDGRQGPGSHTVTFDGSLLPSGVYFYRLSADGFSAMKKMMLVK